ncbi:MAG: tripartite tricarboxylate transporter substrate binding protein [Pseudomonadota bacterium]
MWKKMNRAMSFVAVASLAVGLSVSAAQAEYPEKPITIVLPMGAGGSHDLNARVITSIIPQYLGQGMIVKLTPGAGGQKGTQEVANAEADGYTLLFSHNYLDMLQHHVEKLPYEPMKDFVPVARVNYSPIAVAVPADSPYNTLQELIDAAKEKPGSVRMAHSGNWGALFVPAAQIMKETGAEFNLVPYKGGGPALQALLAGDADVTMGFPSALGSLRDAGKIKILASAGDEATYDGVPTFKEAGLDGDFGYMQRIVLVPAGTPQPVIDKLETAFKELQGDKTYQRMMSRLGENTELMGANDYQKLREQQNGEYKVLVDSIVK